MAADVKPNVDAAFAREDGIPEDGLQNASAQEGAQESVQEGAQADGGFQMGHILSYVPVSDDDEDEPEDNGLLEPANTDVQPEPEEEKELTFEEKLADLEFAAVRQAVHREIHHRVLGECLEMKELPYLEQKIASYPEFSQATLSQYHLIKILVKHHGLEVQLLDDDGNIIDPARLEGLSEDEQDDLIAQEGYLTTDVGRLYYEANLPKNRIQELMVAEPERTEAFRDILEYCREATRSYGDISSLLAGRDVLTTIVDGEPQRIQPSVLIDRLHRAGALVWEDGWNTTEEGERFLEEA